MSILVLLVALVVAAWLLIRVTQAGRKGARRGLGDGSSDSDPSSSPWSGGDSGVSTVHDTGCTANGAGSGGDGGCGDSTSSGGD